MVWSHPTEKNRLKVDASGGFRVKLILVGGFRYFLFSPLPWEDSQFD